MTNYPPPSRRHIGKFYAGYVVCEDPACGGRTRQLPLQFKGAFPVCLTCNSACMSKEYTDKQLYTQLLYYKQGGNSIGIFLASVIA